MMKILIVDDQELVLLSLQKYFLDLGYHVSCANNMSDAIKLYDEVEPSLVISDINMPVLPDSEDTFKSLDYIKKVSGLEIVKYIKIVKKHVIPVMLLSGNNEDSVILKAFELGADDYMKKPVSLDEISTRVAKLLGVNRQGDDFIDNSRLIQKKCIGVIIPFYNLEREFFRRDYAKIIYTKLGYHFCFVNLGISNNLDPLQKLIKGNEERISFYNLADVTLVSEAVRLAGLHLLKSKQFDFIGFINPDLDIKFGDFDDMVNTISNFNLQLVSGAIAIENSINNSLDALASKVLKMIFKKTFKLELNNTLCGAKIMSKDVVEKTFDCKFKTIETFDLEILMRMKSIYGADNMNVIVREQLFKRPMNYDSLKVTLANFVKTLFQMGQIVIHYK